MVNKIRKTKLKLLTIALYVKHKILLQSMCTIFLGCLGVKCRLKKSYQEAPLFFERSKLNIKGSPLLCVNAWHPETLRPVRPRLQDSGKDLNIGVEVQVFNPSL